MHNSYVFEKETTSRHIINVGSTTSALLGAFILVGVTILSLAGCGGGGGSDSGPSSPNMQIRPPSGGGPDLVISSFMVSPEPSSRRQGEPITLSVRGRNQGNAQAQGVTLVYFFSRTESAGELVINRVQVKNLDPSETFSDSYNRIQAAGTTLYYQACVYLEGTLEHCSNKVRVTISGESGGGPGSGSGQPTATWSCPFGNGGSITVGHEGRQVLINAEIHFQGNTCGNFWISAAGGGTNYYREDFGQGGNAYASFHNEPNPNIGGRRGIIFDNGNTSGRTQVRQYTAYFCSKSEVSHSAFCRRGYERSTSTFTVRWLSR